MAGADLDAARDHLLGARRETVVGTLSCADHVAEGWAGGWTTERERVAGAFERRLRETGLLGAYPAVLAECVSAAGECLRAQPVAAPPYVVVTSRGVLLRATLSGGRLLVRLVAFDAEREADGPRYVRGASTPEAAVAVEWR